MASWFDKVTGSNEYERQSWRDSFNGGRAAGDWTGNVNERIEQERSDFQGATWSGSSTQYSALELAKQAAQAGLPKAAAEVRGNAPATATTAVTAAYTGNTVAPSETVKRVTAKGQSVKAVLAGGGGFDLFGNAPAYKPMDLALSGYDWVANPYVSNAEDVETRHGDLAGSVYGLYSMTADAGYNASRAYFGPQHETMSLGTKFGIMGQDAQNATRDAAVGAIFGGYDAIQRWGADNSAREAAGRAAAKDFDEAWDMRQTYDFIENAKRDVRQGLQ